MPEAAGYELFDHTADLGVRVWAPSLPELIAPATAGFYATIGEVLAVRSAAGEPWACTFHTADAAYLLHDYLTELLVELEAQRRCVVDIVCDTFTNHTLRVRGRAVPYNAARSQFEREVKAVTYHELSVQPTAAGYEARYIVDI